MSHSEPEIDDALLDYFPYPVEVVAGVQVPQVIDKMSSTRSPSYPIILGGYDSVERLAEPYIDDYPGISAPEEVLSVARSLVASDVLADLFASNAGSFALNPAEHQMGGVSVFRDDNSVSFEGRASPDLPDGFRVEDGYPRGTWPDTEPSEGQFSGWSDILTGRPMRQCAIGLLPVDRTRPWEVFAHTQFGGWNANPGPEVHVCVARHWHEKFGARVVTHQIDTLEFAVERPVSNRSDALDLAKEMYAYCPDVVDQGTATIDSLAANLLGARVWFFWWD